MNRFSMCILLSSAICIVTVAASTTVRAETSAPPSAVFADKIGAALGKTIDGDALDDGVPLALVELMKHRYPQPNSQKPLLAEYKACAKEFDTRWTAYAERLAVVQAAVKTAAEQKEAKKLDDALATLATAITPAPAPPTDHLGRAKPVKRDFLEVRDAELTAVSAAAAIKAQQRKIEEFPQVRSDFLARRKVSDVAMTERIAWLSTHCGKGRRGSANRFNGFAAGQKPEVREAMQTVLGYVNRLGNNGASNARGFFATLPSYGVNYVLVGGMKPLKKGDWVLMQFEPTKASKKKISYKKKDIWKESFNCQPTDKIKGIDPVTGDFQYVYKCETRTKKSTVTVSAKLAKSTKLKKNARGKYGKIWVLGQMKKPGPRWSLTKARVITLEEEASLKFLR